MSDPQSNIPMPGMFGQTKTLFLEAPGKTGVLLQKVKSGYKERTMRFDDAHGALDWCLEHHAGLILFHPATAQN